MPDDTSNLRNRTYELKIGASVAAAVTVGYIDQPKARKTQTTYERKLGAFGDMVLGDVITGVSVEIDVAMREITQANLARFFPWYSTGDTIALAPTSIGTDLYDYAQVAVLHPSDAADTSEDWVLDKAVVLGDIEVEGDLLQDQSLPMTIRAYPDRSQLPDIVLGTIGQETES